MTKDIIIAKWSEMGSLERDMWVAEVVLKHKVRMLNEVTNNAFKPQYDRLVLDLGNGRYNNTPMYTTHISAAWEIVDKLKIAIIPQSSSAPKELSYMATYENEPSDKEIQIFGETAPEAICLTALISELIKSEVREDTTNEP